MPVVKTAERARLGVATPFKTVMTPVPRPESQSITYEVIGEPPVLRPVTAL